MIDAAACFMEAALRRTPLPSYAHPRNAWSLAQCAMLLDTHAELQKRFFRMAEISMEWALIVGYWPELIAMLESEPADPVCIDRRLATLLKPTQLVQPHPLAKFV